ncbi:MAG TPA: phenylalanine--tRNA ligase subunit beta, partial [Gammaproteobacteria bacterium]|nr:phenylalanine--tRNA ligase subunit beta [Gammaproteobacteria bacterium]
LANPLSAELSVMRTTLWSGLVRAVQHNHYRQQSRIRLFEYGLRFIYEDDELKQENMIAGIAAGRRFPEHWDTAASALDFFDVKGDLQALLALGGGPVAFEAGEHPALHPGQTARIRQGEAEIGWLGCIHPGLAATLDIPANTYVFELVAEAVQAGTPARFQEISRYPAIRRDLAVLVADGVPAEALCAAVREAAEPVLQELRLFDVYRGKGIENGLKSIAFGLILQDSSRTLTDKDVDHVIRGVTAELHERFGATLRE